VAPQDGLSLEGRRLDVEGREELTEVVRAPGQPLGVVVVVGEDLGELVGDKFIFKAGDSRELAERLNTFLALPVLERQGLGVTMRHMAEGHSLTKLAGRLAEEMSV